MVLIIFKRKRTPFVFFKGWLDQDFQGTDLKRAFLGFGLAFQVWILVWFFGIWFRSFL